MTDRPGLPTSLKLVAALFILSGLHELVDMVVGFLQGRTHLNFGVVSIFVGAGLVRLNPAWRTVALVVTKLCIVLTALVAVFSLFATPVRSEWRIYGRTMGEAPRWAGVGIAVVILAVAIWQHRVLNRPDVRALFRNHDR